MKIHEQNLFNRVSKLMAIPLSNVFANSLTARFSSLAATYMNILLGNGAGSGWAFNAEIKSATSFIKNDSPIILDIGANCGDWSFLMKKHFPGSIIYLFEPQPACQEIINKKNIPGSVLIPKAVSSENGSVMNLFQSSATALVASFHERRESYFSDREFTTIQVETITIDSFLLTNNIKTVDFIKIDVEGHELAVLHGAIKSLEGQAIKALSFEFGSGNINSRTFFHDFWDLLTPLGYHISRILPSGRLMPVKSYYEDCEYFRGVTNYIAHI